SISLRRVCVKKCTRAGGRPGKLTSPPHPSHSCCRGPLTTAGHDDRSQRCRTQQTRQRAGERTRRRVPGDRLVINRELTVPPGISHRLRSSEEPLEVCGRLRREVHIHVVECRSVTAQERRVVAGMLPVRHCSCLALDYGDVPHGTVSITTVSHSPEVRR